MSLLTLAVPPPDGWPRIRAILVSHDERVLWAILAAAAIAGLAGLVLRLRARRRS